MLQTLFTKSLASYGQEPAIVALTKRVLSIGNQWLYKKNVIYNLDCISYLWTSSPTPQPIAHLVICKWFYEFDFTMFHPDCPDVPVSKYSVGIVSSTKSSAAYVRDLSTVL